jgi:hypothetical protein
VEKIFKILIVFLLLTLLIVYYVRSRERKSREFVFSHRIPETPPAEDEPELLSSIISHQGIATITDAAAGYEYNYTIDGMLSIYRQGSLKALQRFEVPPDAYYLTVDPIKEEIHLHHEGEIYIYRRAPQGT